MLNVDGSMIGLSKKHARKNSKLLENYLWKIMLENVTFISTHDNHWSQTYNSAEKQ